MPQARMTADVGRAKSNDDERNIDCGSGESRKFYPGKLRQCNILCVWFFFSPRYIICGICLNFATRFFLKFLLCLLPDFMKSPGSLTRMHSSSRPQITHSQLSPTWVTTGRLRHLHDATNFPVVKYQAHHYYYSGGQQLQYDPRWPSLHRSEYHHHE